MGKIPSCWTVAYAAQTHDIYRDMADDSASRYDLSEYPLDHPLYDLSNRKALGFFKNELHSVSMREFVRLCPNLSAVKVSGNVNDEHLLFGHATQLPIACLSAKPNITYQPHCPYSTHTKSGFDGIRYETMAV